MAQTLFRNVTVIDGSGGAPFRGEVLVDGNRIKAVAKAGEPIRAAGAEEIDGGGATLMPGLVESHAHPSFANTTSLEALGEIPPEEHLLLTIKHVKVFLDQGFTSICSAASAKPRLDIVVRNAINAGDIPGPRMLAATPEMTVTSGLGDVRLAHLHRESLGVICDGADEFRRAARYFVREGVDTLKINPSGDEFVPAARGEAHGDERGGGGRGLRGRPFARHPHRRPCAQRRDRSRCALRNGVQIVYHATLSDEAALDALERRRNGCSCRRPWASPTRRCTRRQNTASSCPTTSNGRFEHELESAADNMKKLKRRGVRVLPGGDYGFAWNPIGRNARDLEHFVNLLGYSPMEAIVAATRLGAQIMMKGGELGEVKEGYLADLLLVDGDPAKDVGILQDKDRLLAIMKDGGFHKRPAKQRGIERVAAE